MGRKLRGSYTVEAAMVMGILLFALSHGILWAYGVKDRVTASMMLEEAVEWIRYDEEAPIAGEASEGMEVLGFRIQVREKGDRVEGTVTGRRRTGEISMGRFCPEEFLRRVSVIEEAVGDGDTLPERDQT